MQNKKRWLLGVLSVFLAMLTVLLIVLVMIPQQVSHAARLSPTPACDIQAITVTTALGREPGLVDLAPYSGASRYMYYDPVMPTGQITLTVQLSVPQGTSCQLYGGNAFDRSMIWTGTLSEAWPVADIVYTVAEPFTQTVVQIDAIDVISAPTGTMVMPHPQAVLTLTPDLEPPEILSPTISTVDPRLHGVGASLYYTISDQVSNFTIRAYSVDKGGGLSYTTFSTAAVLGRCGTPEPSALSTSSTWSAEYCLPAAFTSTGAITVTSYDVFGNYQAMGFTFQPDGTPPTSVITSPLSSLGKTPIPVAWEVNDAGSGVARLDLAYRQVSTTVWTTVTALVGDSPTGTALFTPPVVSLTGPLSYELRSQAIDHLNNVEEIVGKPVKYVRVDPIALYLPIVLKNFWPCVAVDREPNNTFDDAQPLTLSGGPARIGTTSGNFCAGDPADYYAITTTGQFLSVKLAVPAGTNLDVYGYDASHAQVFSAVSATGDESVTISSSAGRYYVEVRPAGQADPAYASPYNLEVKDSPQPVINGGFEADLSGWTPSGGLGYSVVGGVDGANGQSALIGRTTYMCRNGVPLDYASLSQSMVVFQPTVGQNIKLRFRYRIYTNDRNRNLTDDFDSFDVLVNNNRVFRDANQTLFDECRVPPFDLGWKWGEYEFTPEQIGTTVTISFQVHNRGDRYYNTYVYLDDVQVVIE